MASQENEVDEVLFAASGKAIAGTGTSRNGIGFPGWLLSSVSYGDEYDSVTEMDNSSDG